MMKQISSAIIGSFILALSAAPAAQAYDIKDNSGYYSYTGSSQRSVILTYYSLEDNLNAYKGDVNIPASITYLGKDLPVKGVGDHALFNCQFVNSVTLPEGVTYIMDQAFSHCYGMKSLSLPSSLELIKDFAFEYCDDLQSVTIPSKVIEFGYAVFSNCLGLQSINVEEGNPVLESIDGVLHTKGGEILVQYPAGRADTEYTIPESVTDVTDYAFSPAPNLKSIQIGMNVSDIQSLTFVECSSLEQINVSDDNDALATVDGVLYDKAMTRLIQYPRASTIGELILPGTVTEIGEMSLSQTENLYSVTLPENVKRIGMYAFLLSNLESIKVLATTPPFVGAMAFDDAAYSSTILYVPDASVDAYRNDETWGQFDNIRPISDSSVAAVGSDENLQIKDGVAITSSDSEIVVYDLSGQKLNAGFCSVSLPAATPCIVTCGGKSLKVML